MSMMINVQQLTMNILDLLRYKKNEKFSNQEMLLPEYQFLVIHQLKINSRYTW